MNSETGDVSVGATMKVDMFKKGDWVDVVGVSKGKGFQGCCADGIIMPVVQRRMVPCSIGHLDRSARVLILLVFGKIRHCPVIWG